MSFWWNLCSIFMEISTEILTKTQQSFCLEAWRSFWIVFTETCDELLPITLQESYQKFLLDFCNVAFNISDDYFEEFWIRFLQSFERQFCRVVFTISGEFLTRILQSFAKNSGEKSLSRNISCECLMNYRQNNGKFLSRFFVKFLKRFPTKSYLLGVIG